MRPVRVDSLRPDLIAPDLSPMMRTHGHQWHVLVESWEAILLGQLGLLVQPLLGPHPRLRQYEPCSVKLGGPGRGGTEISTASFASVASSPIRSSVSRTVSGITSSSSSASFTAARLAGRELTAHLEQIQRIEKNSSNGALFA